MAAKSLILDRNQLIQKIKRIAFEIYERNFKEQSIVLAGIDRNGFIFASMLKKELEIISSIQVTLIKITLDKLTRVQTSILLDAEPDVYTDKTIILTDDVLNTGRVLAYALKPFLEVITSKVQTAVIVDRSHQLFPIVADYVGYTLATTIREHVEVSLDDENLGAYLH